MTNGSDDQADAAEHLTPEPPRGVVLNWSSFFLVQRRTREDDPETQKRPMLLAPSQEGLDYVENLDEIQSIRFVRLTGDGLLAIEDVMHLRYWRLVSGENGVHLTALLCKSGAIYFVGDEQVFEVDEVSRRWIAGSNFKLAQSLPDTFAGKSAEPSPAA